MADKWMTNQKCPLCGRGMVMLQSWGGSDKRATCSDSECPYVDYIKDGK